MGRLFLFFFTLITLSSAHRHRRDRLTPCSARPVRVRGHDDPALDVPTLQNAVAKAAMRSGVTVVELSGTFDLGSCANCVTVPGGVTLRGTGDDPSTPEEPSDATIIKSTATPLIVAAPTGDVVLEKLWFNGAQTLAVIFEAIGGSVTVRNNRVTNVIPGNSFRFAMAGAMPGPVRTQQDTPVSDPGPLTGTISFVRNHIDHNIPWTTPGDDNGFAFAQAALTSIEVRDNFIRAGEAVEIEGCFGLNATYMILDNRIVQTPTPSSLANATTAVQYPERKGGHPAAIKPVGTQAATIVIRNNTIDGRAAAASAVCIMVGTNLNTQSSTVVSGNTCWQSGQFSAFMGGWAGTPLFFAPFWLNDALVFGNTFSGSSFLGFAFLNFTYASPLPNVVDVQSDSFNRARGNIIAQNDLSSWFSTEADISLGPLTSGNVFRGAFSGIVTDLGTLNVVSQDRRKRRGMK